MQTMLYKIWSSKIIKICDKKFVLASTIGFYFIRVFALQVSKGNEA